MTAGVNAIAVAGQDFLLVEARGTVTHLARVSNGDDARAAVNVARAEYPAPPEVIPGYDQAAIHHERWAPKTLCGREWNEMAAGEGGTFRLWQEVSLVPTCRPCLRAIDKWFPATEAPSGMEVVASYVADTVEGYGFARVVSVPAEHVEALRRSIRKQLRGRGFRSETHHVDGVVHVFSEDAHAEIEPEVLAERDREVAARIGQIMRGAATERPPLESQPDVIRWSTWVTVL